MGKLVKINIQTFVVFTYTVLSYCMIRDHTIILYDEGTNELRKCSNHEGILIGYCLLILLLSELVSFV